MRTEFTVTRSKSVSKTDCCSLTVMCGQAQQQQVVLVGTRVCGEVRFASRRVWTRRGPYIVCDFAGRDCMPELRRIDQPVGTEDISCRRPPPNAFTHRNGDVAATNLGVTVFA